MAELKLDDEVRSWIESATGSLLDLQHLLVKMLGLVRSPLPLTHDSVTYYFCCSGCRREFERDPAVYAKKETRC